METSETGMINAVRVVPTILSLLCAALFALSFSGCANTYDAMYYTPGPESRYDTYYAPYYYPYYPWYAYYGGAYYYGVIRELFFCFLKQAHWLICPQWRQCVAAMVAPFRIHIRLRLAH